VTKAGERGVEKLSRYREASEISPEGKGEKKEKRSEAVQQSGEEKIELKKEEKNTRNLDSMQVEEKAVIQQLHKREKERPFRPLHASFKPDQGKSVKDCRPIPKGVRSDRRKKRKDDSIGARKLGGLKGWERGR